MQTLQEGAKVRLIKGEGRENCMNWIAGKVPVGMTGTLVKTPLKHSELFRWDVRWDKPWRIRDKKKGYVFGLNFSDSNLPEFIELI